MGLQLFAVEPSPKFTGAPGAFRTANVRRKYEADMISNLLKRFAADEKGAAYIMAGFAVVPLFGMTALAVDYTNAVRVETQVNAAAQSVALHLAKRTTMNPNIPAEDLVEEGKAMMSRMVTARDVYYDRFFVDPMDGMVQIVARSDVDTYVMHLFGQDKLTVVGRKQAQFGRRNVEVAIAIDNSGSMDWFAGSSRKMDAAKEATRILIDAATESVEDYENADLKFAIVPWHTHVSVPNEYVGGAAQDASWIDWDGKSTEHFRYLPPYQSGSGSASGDMYFPMPRRASHWDNATDDEHVFYTPNRLVDVLPLEADGNGVDLTQLNNLSNIGIVTRRDVYDNFTNVTWNGCFEHRAGDYRISFEAPNDWDGDSLYVPHMAPDEYDTNAGYDGWLWQYRNDYVYDLGGASDFTSGDSHDEDHFVYPQRHSDFNLEDIVRARTFNAGKYAVNQNTKSRTHPWGYSVGPNGKCNVAKVQNLTDSDTLIQTAIDRMDANGGTDLTIGLSWAMNTLTPWEPLVGAADFNDAEKILVFMTDGDNSATLPDEYAMSMSSFGYWKDDPFRKGWGTRPGSGAANVELDESSKQFCDKIKERGVKIYFVYFGTPSSAATGVMNHCATSDETAIAASNDVELKAAFRKIGDDIGKLRLTHYMPPQP